MKHPHEIYQIEAKEDSCNCARQFSKLLTFLSREPIDAKVPKREECVAYPEGNQSLQNRNFISCQVRDIQIRREIEVEFFEFFCLGSYLQPHVCKNRDEYRSNSQEDECSTFLALQSLSFLRRSIWFLHDRIS